MATKRKSKAAPPPATPISQTAMRTLLVAGVSVLIIYVTGFLFAGTEGFRSLLESRMEKQLGMQVDIGGSRSSWSGDIFLSDVVTVTDGDDETPALQIERIEIDTAPWQFFKGNLVGGIRRAQLSHWSLSFSLNDQGGWEPGELGAVTDWLGRWGSLTLPAGEAAPEKTVRGGAVEVDDAGASAPGRSFEVWDHSIISLEDGDIQWGDAAGNVLASIYGVSFIRTPLNLPTRKAGHYHLTVDSAIVADARVRDMDVELLRTGDTYLVLNLHAVRQQGPTTEEPKRVTKRLSARAEVVAPVTPAPPPARPLEVVTVEDVRVTDPRAVAPAANQDFEQIIRGELEDALRE